jgi:hypothetical protein
MPSHLYGGGTKNEIRHGELRKTAHLEGAEDNYQ